MIRNRQHEPVVEEYMHLSPVYQSFTTSLVIFLLLTAFTLVGLVFNCILQRYRGTVSKTDPACQTSRTMSTSKEDPFPPPTPESLPIDLGLSNPLTRTYFPITSGQLAALADRQMAEDNPDQMGQETTGLGELGVSAEETEALQRRVSAYVRYFEDRENSEAWQRRVVILDSAEGVGENVT